MIGTNPVNLRLFGLNVRSDIPLPGMPTATKTTDVHVYLGKVPRELENPNDCAEKGQARPGTLLLSLEDTGRMLVRNGREIIVEPGPNFREERAALYVLGSGFGALLQQRGLLVLHGSSVVIDRRAVAFVGASGNGKSTLARCLVKRGHSLLSDDVSAIDFEHNSTPRVFPSYPQMKLCSDAADHLGDASSDHPQVLPEIPKLAIPVHEDYHPPPTRLFDIFVLAPQPTGPVEIHRINGGQAVAALINNTFRELFLSGLGLRVEQFQLATRLASQIRVYHVRRPKDIMLVEELADRIIDSVRAETGED